jgi:hypothetical protein
MKTSYLVIMRTDEKVLTTFMKNQILYKLASTKEKIVLNAINANNF